MREIQGDEGSTALTAILVLRAILPAPEEMTRDAAIVGGELLSSEQVVEYLESLPKPVQCRGGFSGNMLRIECGPVQADRQWLYDVTLRQTATLEHLLGTDGSAAVRRSRRPALLVCGNGEGLLMSPQSFQGFFKEFLIVDSYGRSGRRPTRREADLGADWVVTFGPSGIRNVHLE